MYELNNKAVKLSLKGKLDQSIKVFKEALLKSPDDSNINFNIALVYIKKEDYLTAIPYLEKSIEILPCDDNLRELGVCYIKLEKLEEARPFLIRAANDFGSSESQNVLGVYFFMISHFEEAQKHFEHAVKLNPENRDAWFNLKDTFLELGMERESKMAQYKFDQLEK